MKTNGKVVSLRRVEKVGEPSEAGLGKLARLISAYAPHDGSLSCASLVYMPSVSRASTKSVCMLLACPRCASSHKGQRRSSSGRICSSTMPPA